MYTNTLFDHVFKNPISKGYTNLHAVSGYVSPAFVDYLLRYDSRINLKVVYGLARNDGILEKYHNHFKRLSNQGRLQLSYYLGKNPCHMKIYAWSGKNLKNVGFVGSANMSNAGFLRNCIIDNHLQSGNIEVIEDSDPTEIINTYGKYVESSVQCSEDDLGGIQLIEIDRRQIVQGGRKRIQIERTTIEGNIIQEVIPCVELSLLANTGETHTRAGLNLGAKRRQRKKSSLHSCSNWNT